MNSHVTMTTFDNAFLNICVCTSGITGFQVGGKKFDPTLEILFSVFQ